MKHLLLIPTPEHREVLLREGLCEARPPMAYTLCDESMLEPDSDRSILNSWEPGPRSDVTASFGGRAGLVLIWDGAVVNEGCDRLARVLNAHVEAMFVATFVATGEVTLGSATGEPILRKMLEVWLQGDALQLAKHARAAGLGTVVVIEEA